MAHGVNLNRNIIESDGIVLNINVTFIESSWVGLKKIKDIMTRLNNIMEYRAINELYKLSKVMSITRYENEDVCLSFLKHVWFILALMNVDCLFFFKRI